MPNPFFYGGRITNPANFIGRTKELRIIFSALETANSGQLQHVQVVGPRRMGKSSLLYHITQIYRQRLTQPEKYRFVYVDLQDVHCHTLEGLLEYILRELNISTQPNMPEFQEAINELNRTQSIYPILCLDEFENLIKHKAHFSNELFDMWRSLASASKLAFVTASQTSLGQLIQQGNLTSTFHNIFNFLELKEFTEPEARALLSHNIDRSFTEEETNKLFKLAHYHPSHLQLAARLLYDAKAIGQINWNVIEEEYKKILDNIKPVEPASVTPPKKYNWNWLTSIGKMVLGLWKKPDEISVSTANLVGSLVIIIPTVLIVSLLVGAVNFEELMNFCYSLKACPFVPPTSTPTFIPTPAP